MRPAIKELMDDHQIILRMLRALNGMCLRLGEGKTAALADLDAALDFIKVFADHAHHGKEEDLLFPAMEEVGFPRQGGPIAVMLMEHEQGRAFVKALAEALERVRKDDDILYPMAMDAVPDARWKVLKDQFDRVEAERMGPERRAGYIALVDRLLSAYPAPELVRPAGGMCH